MDTTKKLRNVHPGEILLEDFLKPMNLSAYALAKEIKVDQTRISQMIKGRRSFSTDTALRLSKFFETSPEFWLNAQMRYDLEAQRQKNVEYESIIPFNKS